MNRPRNGRSLRPFTRTKLQVGTFSPRSYGQSLMPCALDISDEAFKVKVVLEVAQDEGDESLPRTSKLML